MISKSPHTPCHYLVFPHKHLRLTAWKCNVLLKCIKADNSFSLSIYLVLFVLQVAHKASTRARQRCRSAETRSRRPHVQPFSFISLSTVLLQVSLGRPLFLWPSGVHRRAIPVKAVVCWRSTCPIHRQRLRLTWVEMVSSPACLGGGVTAGQYRRQSPDLPALLLLSLSWSI